MVGRRLLVVATAPDAAREVLVTRQRDLVKENVVNAGRYRGALSKPGLLASNRPENHEAGRRLLRPAFGREQVRDGVEPEVRAETERLSASWARGGIVDVERALSAGTLRIAARALFGVDLPDADAVATDIRSLLGAFSLVISARSMVRNATRVRSSWRFVQVAKRLDAFGARLVEGPGPVASALRAAQIAHDERAAEARNIAIAATETTSSVLTWSLLEVARDRVLQAAVAEDGDALAERVFTETLRLYPPAWYIGRLALSDVELAGEAVAEGTMVLVSPYLLHRDERHHERPETFDPDRWLEGTAAATRAFTFLPFGAGSRRCIGEEIAWLEGRVILAELVRSLELEVAGDYDVGIFPGASLRPARPVLLRARSRSRPLSLARS